MSLHNGALPRGLPRFHPHSLCGGGRVRWRREEQGTEFAWIAAEGSRMIHPMESLRDERPAIAEGRRRCLRMIGGFSGLILLLCPIAVTAVSTHCDVCRGSFGEQMFAFTDRVDQTKKWVCEPCADLTTTCYVCGLPVWKGFETLSDGRMVCARDRVGLVVDEEEARRVCADVDATLLALLGRFTEFPGTNVYLRLADRVDVRTLVGVAGHDFTCPNLLGYTLSLQKPGYLHHDIRLLTGMQKGIVQATYAHELAHAWVNENLPRSRSLSIHPDALEGFCELIGFLVAQAYRDDDATQHVLNNGYTRGQVLVFIEAERQYGFMDVLDWVRYGNTSYLDSERLQDVRDVTMPGADARTPLAEVLFIPPAPASLPEVTSLELTSVSMGPRVALATINGKAFEVNEARKLPFGASNIIVRCMTIESASVLIERSDTKAQERLELRRSGRGSTVAP